MNRLLLLSLIPLVLASCGSSGNPDGGDKKDEDTVGVVKTVAEKGDYKFIMDATTTYKFDGEEFEFGVPKFNLEVVKGAADLKGVYAVTKILKEGDKVVNGTVTKHVLVFDENGKDNDKYMLMGGYKMEGDKKVPEMRSVDLTKVTTVDQRTHQDIMTNLMKDADFVKNVTEGKSFKMEFDFVGCTEGVEKFDTAKEAKCLNDKKISLGKQVLEFKKAK